MFLKLKNMIDLALKYGKLYDIFYNPEFESERIYGELLRNVHSIEKGLSLKNVRYGFGIRKIEEAYGYARKLISINDEKYNEAIAMFTGALDAYICYHEEKNFSNVDIEQVKAYTNELKNALHENQSVLNYKEMGGFKKISYHCLTNDEKIIINDFILSRHSIREFSGTPVEECKLVSAISMAHHCPSACNRQGYRVHIIEKSKFSFLNNWFEGVGGFSDELDKILLITGKLSVYRNSEQMQYVVSSSVFAAYLTLTLQAEGIGCCFIQRPVVYTEKWNNIREKLDIPRDEQIVCALGIGNLTEEYKVPISHRIDLHNIISWHQ